MTAKKPKLPFQLLTTAPAQATASPAAPGPRYVSSRRWSHSEESARKRSNVRFRHVRSRADRGGAVAVVLLMGLNNMARGGSPHRSQKLMRMRVLLQFVAIIVIMLTIWAFR